MTIRHQIKSRWYYIFWGLMAASVVGGQIYIATGYHAMSKTILSCDKFQPLIRNFDNLKE
tara:strand:- start:1060 stop:1239 length:180 start_codon:yes stop_codon:yes gene_type:complete